MKKILILMYSILLCSFSFAQENETSKLLSTPGQLLQRDLYLIDKLPSGNYSIRVETIIITNVNTKAKTGAVKLTTYSTVGSQLTTHEGILDSDEIEPAIKTIEYIKNYVLKSNPEVDTEVEFLSKGNVRIGAYYIPRLKEWVTYFDTKGIATSKGKFPPEKIDEVLNVLKAASKNIKDKTK